METVQNIKPTILIGCSTQRGAFNQTVVQTMASQVKHPIILPLSNPNENAEAHPSDLIAWTENKALIATGSPFDDISYRNQAMIVAQCNNALAFPGIGLGVIAVKATQVSDDMLWTAVQVLSEHAPVLQDLNAPLLPSLANAEKVAKAIAIAVAKTAIKQGFANIPADSDVEALVTASMWEPNYLPYRKL